MWVDQRDEINTGIYTPHTKDFGKFWGGGRRKNGPKEIDDWIGCREVFHGLNRRLRRFYFKHDLPVGSGRSISVFFDKVEDRLNLAPEDRSRFGPTNKRKILWVEASEWWRGHSMRRSLFTALLKQSTEYRIHADNFDETIYGGEYLRNTREAVDRFLAGNTYYWGRQVGWMTAFDPDEWDFNGYDSRKIDLKHLLRNYPRPLPPRRNRTQTAAVA